MGRVPFRMGSFTCHGHLDLTAPDEDGRIAELADATTAEDVYRALAGRTAQEHPLLGPGARTPPHKTA